MMRKPWLDLVRSQVKSKNLYVDNHEINVRYQDIAFLIYPFRHSLIVGKFSYCALENKVGRFNYTRLVVHHSCFG